MDLDLVATDNSELKPAKLRQKQQNIASKLRNEAKAAARIVYRKQKEKRVSSFLALCHLTFS